MDANDYIRAALTDNGLMHTGRLAPARSGRRKKKYVRDLFGHGLCYAGPVFFRTREGLIRIA